MSKKATKQIALNLLRSGNLPGSELRIRLGMSSPGFYLMMSELEEEGLVKSYDVSTNVEGVTLLLRWFELVRSKKNA